MATQPAEFAGLAERKGRIAPGYDADLVVFDDSADFVITSDIIKYRHKITPYEGRTVKGVIDKTLVRGRPVYADGDMVGTPAGQAILGQANLRAGQAGTDNLKPGQR
jgi:allantoinase